MTKTAMFSFVRMSPNSMVASVRIGYWLEKKLKLSTIWDGSIGDHTDLDHLIIVNGAFGFSKHLEALSRAIYGAKKVIWVQNDYTIIPPRTDGDAASPFRNPLPTKPSSPSRNTRSSP